MYFCGTFFIEKKKMECRCQLVAKHLALRRQQAKEANEALEASFVSPNAETTKRPQRRQYGGLPVKFVGGPATNWAVTLCGGRSKGVRSPNGTEQSDDRFLDFHKNVSKWLWCTP